MRRFVGPIVCFVGAFLVAIGLLAQFYVGKALLRTPLDVDEIIHVDGTAQVPNAKGKIEETPVLAWSVYHVDTTLSDSKVVSFQNSQCLVKDIGNPTERKRRAVGRAGRILDVLDHIKVAMLDGGLNGADLDRSNDVRRRGGTPWRGGTAGDALPWPHRNEGGPLVALRQD